jgi:hypothetical protein
VSRRITIDFAHSESEERKRQQLESVLGGGAVIHFGQEGVL